MFYAHANNVAIVHDTAAHSEDSDQVLAEISQLLPAADILTVQNSDYRLVEKTTINAERPRQSTFTRGYSALMSLGLVRPRDLSRYQIIISNCAGLAKKAASRAAALHICYCHSPYRTSSPATLSARQRAN